MPTEREDGQARDGAPEAATGVVVDAHLHVEIAGAQVHGSLHAASTEDQAFDGWGGLIGAVLALAGHEAPPALTPDVRRRR